MDRLPNRATPKRRLEIRIAGVQWRWVSLAGMGVPLISAMLTLSVNVGCTAVAFSFPNLDKEEITRIIDLCLAITTWSALPLNALLTLGAATWAARKAGKSAIIHGALTGLLSTTAVLILGLIAGLGFGVSGTAQEAWNLTMLALTTGAGWLGGLNANATLCRQEALYATSRAISTARTHQAIVEAIGNHLAGTKADHVTLWQVDEAQSDGQTRIRLLAAWSSDGAQTLPLGLVFDSNEILSLAHLRQAGSLLIKTAQVPRAERTVWERLGVRSALLMPLTDAQDTLIGLLVIASTTSQGFKQDTWHAHVISPQVALALQNLRLVEGARQAAILGERQRLAREIHDTLAQDFASVVMHLEAAAGMLTDETAPAQQHIDQAKHTARDGLGQTRKLVWALRPDILEGTTLAAALERAAVRWGNDTGTAVTVVATGTAYPLPPDVEVTLLRAAQEALSNVHKHARAKQVTVTLSYMSDVVVLDVQDDGQGFDPEWAQSRPMASDTGGFGLTAMRERVEQLGGTLFIESTSGEGTTLVIEIPAPTEA